MPPFSAGYSDTELAAVANYVIARFGGKTGRASASFGISGEETTRKFLPETSDNMYCARRAETYLVMT
jgi:hypothetical protein